MHNAHLADSASLQALAEIQALPQHGLRIIAGVDADNATGAIPEQMRALTALGEVVHVPPLTADIVTTFLRTLLGEGIAPSASTMLFHESEGWPVLMTETLRSWVESGVLARIVGRWTFYPAGDTSPSDPGGLRPQDRQRLGEAALALPATVNFLAALWHTTDSDARITLDCARALGYVRTIDVHHAELVQCIDSERTAQFLDTVIAGAVGGGSRRNRAIATCWSRQ